MSSKKQDQMTFTVDMPSKIPPDLQKAIRSLAREGLELNLEVLKDQLSSVGIDIKKLGTVIMRLMKAFSDQNLWTTLKTAESRASRSEALELRKSTSKAKTVDECDSTSRIDVTQIHFSDSESDYEEDDKFLTYFS